LPRPTHRRTASPYDPPTATHFDPNEWTDPDARPPVPVYGETKWCAFGQHWHVVFEFAPAPNGKMGRARNCKFHQALWRTEMGGAATKPPRFDPTGPRAKIVEARAQAEYHEREAAKWRQALRDAELAVARGIDQARKARASSTMSKQREAEAAARVELEQKKRLRREKRLSAAK
jgi:hypothetical protein